jgi:hypothetical protein
VKLVGWLAPKQFPFQHFSLHTPPPQNLSHSTNTAPLSAYNLWELLSSHTRHPPSSPHSLSNQERNICPSDGRVDNFSCLCAYFITIAAHCMQSHSDHNTGDDDRWAEAEVDRLLSYDVSRDGGLRAVFSICYSSGQGQGEGAREVQAAQLGIANQESLC